MTGSFADRLFRISFALAGCYNLAFGLWAGFWPNDFFHRFGISPPRYPGIWACLGMVVGVYGFLYLHASWKLAAAWPIIAVGLLGKVLGPIGMFASISDEWPSRLGMICVTNDIVWWLPFGLFLVRGSRLAKFLESNAPLICATMHALALLLMAIVLRSGMAVNTVVVERGRYIANHERAWSLSWAVWMLAGMSIVAFYAWWASRLRTPGAALAGVLIAGAGLVFDLAGESLSVLVLQEYAIELAAENEPAPTSLSRFVAVERASTLLTAGLANGLYTLGGVVLMLATPNLSYSLRGMMTLTWLAGATMTISAIFHHTGGMVGATILLFPTLILWTAWMGFRWRPA